MGRLRQRLLVREELDDSLVLLVSDHGASEVHTHLDLADWFRPRAFRPSPIPLSGSGARAAVMVAGNGSAMVYASPGVSRTDRWPSGASHPGRIRQPRRSDRQAGPRAVGGIRRRGIRERGIWLESEKGSARVSSRDGIVSTSLSREIRFCSKVRGARRPRMAGGQPGTARSRMRPSTFGISSGHNARVTCW